MNLQELNKNISNLPQKEAILEIIQIKTDSDMNQLTTEIKRIYWILGIITTLLIALIGIILAK